MLDTYITLNAQAATSKNKDVELFNILNLIYSKYYFNM